MRLLFSFFAFAYLIDVFVYYMLLRHVRAAWVYLK